MTYLLSRIDLQRLPRIDVRRLRRADLVQLAASVIFGASLFMSWYGTAAANRFSNVAGRRGGVSAWAAHGTLRFVFLAAVVAGFLSAWQTLRAHELAWHRGEMTGVVAITMATLVLYHGFISRPGGPSGTVSLEPGWFIAMAAALVPVGTALVRTPAEARLRKPPGSV